MAKLRATSVLPRRLGPVLRDSKAIPVDVSQKGVRRGVALVRR